MPAAWVGDTALVAGGVDSLAEQICASADAAGDALVICGTTLITWATVSEYREVTGLWSFPHSAPGLFLVGGPSNAGGLFLGWARRLLGRSQRTLDPQRVPVWTPYVRGERTPKHDTSLRATLHGLDLTHDAATLRRAAYEAAGFVVRHHLDLAGCQANRIVVTRGGVRDKAWIQALADCTGLPVDCVAVPEGAALGMAWFARMAPGLEGPDARWSRTRGGSPRARGAMSVSSNCRGIPAPPASPPFNPRCADPVVPPLLGPRPSLAVILRYWSKG